MSNAMDFAWHTAIPVETGKRYATIRRAFNKWSIDLSNPLVTSGSDILHLRVREGKASRTITLNIEYGEYGQAVVNIGDGSQNASINIDMREDLRPPEEHTICGVAISTEHFQEVWNSSGHVSEVISRLGISDTGNSKTPAKKRLAYLAHKLRKSGVDIKKYKRGRKKTGEGE